MSTIYTHICAAHDIYWPIPYLMRNQYSGVAYGTDNDLEFHLKYQDGDWHIRIDDHRYIWQSDYSVISIEDVKLVLDGIIRDNGFFIDFIDCRAF